METKLFVLTILAFYLVQHSVEAKIHTAQACEGHKLKMTCHTDEEIVILDAFYGRKDRTTCMFLEDPHVATNCFTPFAATILKSRCHGQSYCKVKVNNDEFTDPCPGQVKYGEVKYMCAVKPKNPTQNNNHVSGNNHIVKPFVPPQSPYNPNYNHVPQFNATYNYQPLRPFNTSRNFRPSRPFNTTYISRPAHNYDQNLFYPYNNSHYYHHNAH